MVRARTLAVGAIIDGVRRGRSWLAESSAVNLSFTASLGDRTVSCGDRLGAAPTDLVAVRLEVAGVPGCVAQVRGPAGVLGGTLADEAGRAVVEVQVPAGTGFVRAEVRRLDGTPEPNPLAGVAGLAMVALTNPVFLG